MGENKAQDKHHLQSKEPEEQCSFNMFNLTDLSEPKAEPFNATLLVNGKEWIMKVDMGASASVISQATYNRLWRPGEMPTLEKSDMRLRQYNGECIPLLASIHANIVYQGQEDEGRLLVVKGEGSSLLGLDLLLKIHLNWAEIRFARGVSDILAKYADVFKDELGTRKGTTVKLIVDPSAQPRFFKPRTVPYAMKTKVEAELERLQQLGVTEPIEFPD